MGLLSMWGLTKPTPPAAPVKPSISVSDLSASHAGPPLALGSGFGSGFGSFSEIHDLDHHSTRELSEAAFSQNPYAAGLINRLVTAEIHSGLTLELYPQELVLGVEEGSMRDYAALTEARFNLWSDDPQSCDWRGAHTFGQLQAQARREALVAGDCLVLLRYKDGLPKIQIIPGSRVIGPLVRPPSVPARHRIVDGVEFDPRGQEVAYWVSPNTDSLRDLALEPTRVPAFGRRSGRRLAFLLRGEADRVGRVRGRPILSRLLESMSQLDQYRDATAQSAVLNSMLAIWVQKDLPMPGSKPISNAAVRRGAETEHDGPVHNGTNTGRTYNTAGMAKGTVIETLQAGEKIHSHTHEIGTSFAEFETPLVNAFGWTVGVPPEILRQEFNKSFSASQAAILEFRLHLSKVWADFGSDFCRPIFEGWLIGSALKGDIRQPGLVESWRDQSRRPEFLALTKGTWCGTVKVSADPTKQVKASQALVDNGWSTNAREARLISGSRFDDNVAIVRRENEALAQMRKPLDDAATELHLAMTPAPAESSTQAAQASEGMGVSADPRTVGVPATQQIPKIPGTWAIVPGEEFTDAVSWANSAGPVDVTDASVVFEAGDLRIDQTSDQVDTTESPGVIRVSLTPEQTEQLSAGTPFVVTVVRSGTTVERRLVSGHIL